MRLPGNVRKFGTAFGLIATLSACSGGDDAYLAPSSDYYAVDRAQPTPVAPANGPQADFPQVLGDPFVVDGQSYTPADVLSYDAVGYAAIDPAGGQGITISHKTLPLPSYVELTSLDTGRTILARAERRGPMTSSRIIGLSQGAAQELGVGEGAPVRVRRVNPPEYERSALRSGQAAGSRLDTPDTLLTVLRKQLPANGATSLARSGPSASAAASRQPPPSEDFGNAFPEFDPGPSSAAYGQPETRDGITERTTNYALAPIGESPTGAGRAAPVEVARMPAQRQPTPVPPRMAPTTQAAPPPVQAAEPAPRRGRFLVQVASFSSRDNAIEAADELSGFVVQAGRFYRLRLGPFATRGEADAALAKAMRSGYRDAFVDTSN